MFILDEHLAYNVLKSPLPRRLKFSRLVELRPGEIILDERVPEVLLSLPHPTFITIDGGFWSPGGAILDTVFSASPYEPWRNGLFQSC
jgi:hypothetical protein